MELENQEYERWKVWSEMESQTQNQKTAAFIGNSGAAEEKEAEEVVEEVAEPLPEPATPAL